MSGRRQGRNCKGFLLLFFKKEDLPVFLWPNSPTDMDMAHNLG
jgi:hypothetical protein